MLPKRLKISKIATDTLKLLKARTGVTPNLVCRMALLLSLEDGKRGGMKDCDQDGSEFNSITLFGEHEQLFECLLIEVHGALDGKQYASVISSHIETGLVRLRKSKTLIDLVSFSGIDEPSAASV